MCENFGKSRSLKQTLHQSADGRCVMDILRPSTAMLLDPLDISVV